MQHWTRRLGLADNEAHWRARGVDFWVSSGAGAHTTDDVQVSRTTSDAATSILYARFSMARFAHVQAIELADWVAFVRATDLDAVTHDAPTSPGVLSSRFATPSAATANATLIVLNGWGFGVNVSADGRTLMHRAFYGHRYVFDDPLPMLFRALRCGQGAKHVVQYGSDHIISGALLEQFYRARLGSTLHRYGAHNLSPQAARLPYALELPIGLNYHARALGELLAQRADLHVGTAHRSAELLCCCMAPWRHRVRIL